MLAASAAVHGDPTRLDIQTPHGLARAHVHALPDARAALLLGHGAGGSVEAPDLLAVTRAALERSIAVVRVEQPYRVAGKKATPRTPVLDEGWLAVVEHLRDTGPLGGGIPLVQGGRSSGARVACRTAAATRAVAVLCLAFPLSPPQRDPAKPRATRQPELDEVAVPLLVVQGATDRFGVPEPAAPLREVVVVQGDHALKRDTDAVASATGAWLERVL